MLDTYLTWNNNCTLGTSVRGVNKLSIKDCLKHYNVQRIHFSQPGQSRGFVIIYIVTNFSASSTSFFGYAVAYKFYIEQLPKRLTTFLKSYSNSIRFKYQKIFSFAETIFAISQQCFSHGYVLKVDLCGNCNNRVSTS